MSHEHLVTLFAYFAICIHYLEYLHTGGKCNLLDLVKIQNLMSDWTPMYGSQAGMVPREWREFA